MKTCDPKIISEQKRNFGCAITERNFSTEALQRSSREIHLPVESHVELAMALL